MIPLILALTNIRIDSAYPVSIIDSWNDVLSGMVPQQAKLPRRIVEDAMGRFPIWLSTAPIDDIIELRAPSTECWNNLNLDSDDGHSIADPYRWISDRYLYSDLAQWAAPSLRFEYRYITRGDLNGFPKGAITDVKVDPDKLNAIIAEHTVYHAEPSMELYSKVFAMAVRYLKRNDYQSASALFGFYLQENPGDAKAINARGFCMLPEKPYDAERIILKALRNGFGDKAVGYYNLGSVKPELTQT